MWGWIFKITQTLCFYRYLSNLDLALCYMSSWCEGLPVSICILFCKDDKPSFLSFKDLWKPVNDTMIPSKCIIKDFQKMCDYKCHTYLWLALFEARYFDGYLLLSCSRELLFTYIKVLNIPAKQNSNSIVFVPLS